ncbi:MAG: Uma2 family endonuclease [Anaerolineae bacterium]|nr:Uma2 family endonuclease [Anaerolineae bacterium]
MTVTTLHPKLQTAYELIEQLPDHVTRYEIWDGELIVTPAPTLSHQTLSKRLVRILVLHDPEEAIGAYFYAPMDVILLERTTVQPDVFWIAKANEGIIQPKHIIGAPDLCIEVISPSTEYADRERKFGYYRDGGVREYWLVDPAAQTLTVYALGSSTHTVYGVGATAHSGLTELAGLTVDVAKLFEDLPPLGE